ncbi:MAG: MBG domain-containing protein [Mediterraneibacter faecis]
MKNAKRCLAILLAVTLLCSNGVSQLGTIVSASELETTEEAQPKEDAVVEQAEETKEDTGKATVEGVTPEEERGESSAQDAETANVPKAAAQEGQNEANVPEAAPATVAPTTVAPTTVAPTTATPATVTPATAVPASEGAGQQGEATAPEVQTYNVKINKSELNGGQIKIWVSDNNKVDVTEYDGNNQYVKEVKEGEEFNFQITLNDGFEIAQVKVNGNAFDPANTEGNVITYKVAGINEEKVIDVTYNKVETPAEEKAAEEPKTEDETKVEEPAVAETAEPEDNSVNTASLNENVSTVANTDTNRTVRVGQTITLDSKNVEKGFFNYTHEWTVNDNTIVRLNTTSGTSITVTGLKAGETIVTDAYTKQSIFGLSNGKKTYTITVRSAVTPTNITIEGSDKVTQFQTMQLTAKLTPADADGTVTWSSSNEQILSVDDKGVVTGRRQGEATVTASVQGTAVSTTKKITVEQDTATKGTKATVYFLLDPTKDPNSNDQSEWGEAYGTAVVNLENAKWVNDKNCFEDVDQRVISWPKGTNIIPRNSKEWDQIFNNYQATLKAQFGELQFSKDDVEEITLVPAKISKNNGTTSTSLATHLDCSVNIKCKNIALVKYYLFDAGGTGYVQQGSQNYIINDSAKTDPKSVIGNDFPETKTVSGVTYTFSGWYTDQSLTKPAPEFPAKVTASVDYYAKYIAGYQVMYNLAGGKFSDGSTSATEKHNVDTMVVVREQPTRAGYKFTGWTVEGLGETTSLNSGAIFTMPNGNVTLTAKWEEQKIEKFLTLVPKDVSKPYDGTELQAGTAKVTGKVEGADTASVKIEYSLNGKDWTTNPSEVTATNVSDSKTVQVRATSEKYTGELTGTEELTITPKPVTVTANSYNKTYGASDPEFTVTVVGTLGTDKVTYNLSREAGEDVGTYPITASGDVIQGNYNVTYHPGTLTITAATRPEDRQLGVTSYEGVYDANEHTITVDNVLDGDVVEYSYDGGETWTTNLDQYKDVTETTIKVRVTNANYDPNPVELEGTVKITPKPVTVTANSYNKAYGATDTEFTATVEGTLGSDTVNYKLNRETGEDVGTYKILAIGDAAQGNYSVTYYPGTLTITAATRPEDRQLGVTSYEGVYDANEHTITVDNVLDGDVVEYSYDGGETWTTNLDQYKDVTETTIKVRVTNANYDPNPVELEGTVKITPKPVTVTANSYNKAYGATDPEFTATVEGTLGSDTVNYKLNRETGEDVGTYKILAIGDAAQGNYSVTYYPGTLTITAATRPEDRQLGVTSYEGVYDANEHTITVDNVLDGDVVEYSYDGGETWTTNLNQYKDVTETTIKVRVTNANYDPSPVELEGTVKITPATLTVSTPIATKVYEGTPLTAAGTISGFVNGETATFTTTGSQTEVGSTANTYSLTWDGTAKESNYTVAETIGTLTVTAQSIDPENPDYKGITVDAPTDVEYTGEDQTWLPTVTDGNGKALVKDTDYTVTYDNEDRTNVTGIITVTINGAGNYAGTITRTYQITPKPVTITTESKTRAFDGTALTAGGKVEGIVSGETYGFKTTGSQTYVGSSQNTYEMVWADSEVEGTSGTYTAKKTNYTVTESIGTLVVTAGTPENPLDPTLVVNKTHDKSQTYKAGDVITFTITAKNIYEEAKTITLEELEGVALDANVFENVASGAEVTATATYTVTEQDIVNGTFTNNVTVTFSGVDDKFTGTDTVDELEDANPHMTITKTTVGAEEGHIYKLNDVINYKITATNDGNLTLTNVKVEDALTGNVGKNAFTIDILAPGEAQTFDVRYVVTENDVLEGKVINNATGTATDPTDPDEPKTPVTPGEKEDPIETPNPSLAVVKTSDKTGVVKLGETITYTITVTNNGNVTINDIEVTDELTGNTGDNAFTIDRLAVGETKQFTATYTVTEDDILEGTIVNRATATGKDPRNEEVTGEGEVRVDTEEKDDSKKDDSKKNDSDKKPGAVKTGDATDVIPFFGMTVLAAGAAIVIALKKKRRA